MIKGIIEELGQFIIKGCFLKKCNSLHQSNVLQKSSFEIWGYKGQNKNDGDEEGARIWIKFQILIYIQFSCMHSSSNI